MMRRVRDVIDRNPFWVPEDMPLEQVAAELADRQVNAAPVCARDGRIVGVLSKTDLTQHYDGNERGVARDAMTPEILAVSADASADVATERMAFEGVHQLVVTDEDGRFVGVVTAMDILRELAGYGRTAPRIIAVAP